MTRCPRPHCGGQLFEVPIAERVLRSQRETICSLCARAPGEAEPPARPARALPPVCKAGHPSSRYGYWSERGKPQCDRCNTEQLALRQQRNRIGLEVGRERGWRLEGRDGYKGRNW